ncbi:MAG: ABC-F type ribosomal protection protein [Syntrophomonadaceae bacterium]|nr:ABC-F type ribosomal protection protein [Syntrophomonadaceae bacterium]
MAILLSCRGVSKTYGESTVLRGIDLDIHAGERIGLVGRNGAGKTTLAHIIGGVVESDNGTVIKPKPSLRIACLRQVNDLPQDMGHDMGLGEYGATELDQIKLSGQLGLKPLSREEERQFASLSGGEKTKLNLAAIWAAQPDLLILDEPTNNLDIRGMEWLVAEIGKYRGAALIISHDRYFLDQAVNRIIEIENGMINHYNGNYSYYRDEKKRRCESRLHQHEAQEKTKQRIADDIEQLTKWSAKAHRESRRKAAGNGAKMGVKEYFRAKAKKRDKSIKSKLKQLQKIEVAGIARPIDESRVKFGFARANRRGKRVLEARDITKSFGPRLVFGNSSFYIQRGEKVGVFGSNGCGKTTLVKTILGEEDLTAGEIFFSPGLQVGYLDQELADLDGEQTIAEFLDIEKDRNRGMIVTLLVNLGLSEAMLDQPVNTLSLGERKKLKIAQIVLQENDILILDEPGNHLDLHSREQLEKTLQAYNGTVILVSHDRYMLQQICQTYLLFKQQKIMRVEGDWEACQKTLDQTDKPGKEPQTREKQKIIQEEKLLMETRLAYWLGEIGRYKPGQAEYTKADQQIRDLIKSRNELIDKSRPF